MFKEEILNNILFHIELNQTWEISNKPSYSKKKKKNQVKMVK